MTYLKHKTGGYVCCTKCFQPIEFNNDGKKYCLCVHPKGVGVGASGHFKSPYGWKWYLQKEGLI